MNEREILKKFVRVERTGKEVQIRVCEIRWHGAHTPIFTWVTAKSIPATASKAEIKKAEVLIQQDKLQEAEIILVKIISNDGEYKLDAESIVDSVKNISN